MTKSVWISARVSCNMDLARYPADTQHCQFVSFSPTGAAPSICPASLLYVGVQTDIDLNQVTLSSGLDLQLGPFKTSYRAVLVDTTNSATSNQTMALEITFKRKSSAVIIDSVIPAMMVCSWHQCSHFITSLCAGCHDCVRPILDHCRARSSDNCTRFVPDSLQSEELGVEQTPTNRDACMGGTLSSCEHDFSMAVDYRHYHIIHAVCSMRTRGGRTSC